MRIFELTEDFKIKIDPEVLYIPDFKKVYDADKGKKKDTAMDHLAYIYYMCDFNSPYSNFPEQKRKETVCSQLFQDANYKIPPYVLVAMGTYIEMNVTPLQAYYDTCREKLHQMNDYLKTSPVSTDAGYKLVEATFKNMDKTVVNLAKLKEQVEKEKTTNDNNRRAGKSTALFEE